MFREHFTQTVITVLAVVIGLIMSFTACIVDGLPLHYGNIFKLWGMITLVVLLVSMFVPYKKWSALLMEKIPVSEGSMAYKLLDNVIPTLVLNTFITVMVSGANIIPYYS